jgi:hypothetical protein
VDFGNFEFLSFYNSRIFKFSELSNIQNFVFSFNFLQCSVQNSQSLDAFVFLKFLPVPGLELISNG